MGRRVTGIVVLHATFEKDGDQWVGECLELGTSTFGATLDEVQADLLEAIELHLNTLERTGERARFFREHGITLRRSTDGVPKHVQADVPVLRSRNHTTLSSVTFAVPV